MPGPGWLAVYAPVARRVWPRCSLAAAISGDLRIFNTGPLDGVHPLPEGEVLGDLALAKHQTIGKSSPNPSHGVL